MLPIAHTAFTSSSASNNAAPAANQQNNSHDKIETGVRFELTNAQLFAIKEIARKKREETEESLPDEKSLGQKIPAYSQTKPQDLDQAPLQTTFKVKAGGISIIYRKGKENHKKPPILGGGFRLRKFEKPTR